MLEPIEYDICQTQGMIYEYAWSLFYDMKSFSEGYMRSDFCRREMDSRYSVFQLQDPEECFDFLDKDVLQDKPVLSGRIDKNTAYWIGFTYRQLHFETGMKSREIEEKVSFKAMMRYYPGLHTVDEDVAAEIICEDFGLIKRE